MASKFADVVLFFLETYVNWAKFGTKCVNWFRFLYVIWVEFGTKCGRFFPSLFIFARVCLHFGSNREQTREYFHMFVYFCPCLFPFLVILGTNTGKSLAIDVIIFCDYLLTKSIVELIYRFQIKLEGKSMFGSLIYSASGLASIQSGSAIVGSLIFAIVVVLIGLGIKIWKKYGKH
ncbi:hypothetical protein HMPREF3216_01082 [Gardnerella vaginalis]|uniref:Uncharacterized protein n=1 Tax=Gardnerella vaginalis TaxID=2702 RepID=A0A133NMR5_GARVA|nr:hypothetical protein HMPREF3216_01082 [Gardnerella vaginalis]